MNELTFEKLNAIVAAIPVTSGKKWRVGFILPALPGTVVAAIELIKTESITPVLIGVAAECERVRTEWKLDCETIVGDPMKGVAKAIEEGKVDLLVRGCEPVRSLLSTLLRTPAFRKGWIAGIGIIVPPKLNRPLIVADTSVTPLPTLDQKIKIVELALSVARKIGIEQPKVALLAGVETVAPDVSSGVHDAVIAKMGERKQFGNALLDGPLALDLALSEEAATKKKIAGPVAGKADVLIAPNLEAGNGLYKAQATLGRAASASIVLGGKLPIALPSRSEPKEAIVAAIRLAIAFAS